VPTALRPVATRCCAGRGERVGAARDIVRDRQRRSTRAAHDTRPHAIDDIM
jgi:hypothetical protein